MGAPIIMIELHCKFGGQTPSASIFLAIFLHLRVGFWGVKMSPGGGVGFEGAKWHGRSLSYVPFDPAFSLRSNRQPPVAIAHRLRTAFQENQALELNTQALGLRLGT